MFNVAQIQECFSQLVGFLQPSDPKYKKIDTQLTVSRSGKFVQRTHSLLSMENIYNAAPEFNGFTYPNWNDTTQFAKDAIVVYTDGKKYLALADNTNITPGTDVTKWIVIDPFSNWLETLYKNACSNLVSDLITYKKVNEIAKSLIDSMRLYEGFGTLTDRIIKHGRFVGLQFKIKAQENMVIKINSLGLQIDQIQETPLKVYLYHSSVLEPLKTFDININKAVTFVWHDLEDALMDFFSANHDSSGVFFLGYYEDDLVGQAIKKRITLSSQPCGTCSGYDIAAYKTWSKHVSISSIEVATAGLDEDKNLFDTQFMSLSTETNFGMNLSISVSCDLTTFFCNNSMLFSDALCKRVALELLQEMAYSTRINAVSDKVKALAMADLSIDAQEGSFKLEYFEDLKALNFDFSGFSSDCLPCVKKKGFNYGSV